MAETGESSSVPDAEEPRGDAGTGADDDSGMLSSRVKAGILIAALGVFVPGIVDNLLTQAGAPGLGVIVWVVGFGSAVVAFWYVVLRPMDIGAETEG